MKKEYTNEILHLFKALKVEKKVLEIDIEKKKELFKRTIKRGFVYSDEVIASYNTDYLLSLFDQIAISIEQANSTFHKSWDKVANSSIEELVMEQLFHYITTYGFERLGVFDKDTVFIPKEELEIPNIDIYGFSFSVIKGLTEAEIKEKCLFLLRSGIALSEESIKSLVSLCSDMELTIDEVETVKNKEAKLILLDTLGMVPKQPEEFLRYLVYKATEKTLLIKNKELIDKIKEKENTSCIFYFDKYIKDFGIDKLARIFYRYKSVFLAFRTNKKLKRIVNKIRREAVKYHQPMQEDYLNSVTGKIKIGNSICIDELNDNLGKVNIFRKIRLAQALNYRILNSKGSILYKVRNGKGYATNFDGVKDKTVLMEILNKVWVNIVNDIKGKTTGKKIYIPDYIDYALPATEKQFIGNFPCGTSVNIDNDMVFGVHWFNDNRNRIDLDLSLIDVNGMKFGWDSSYRNSKKTILFSGDVTDASGKLGATELFYLANGDKRVEGIMMVNFFNCSDTEKECEFDIVVAKEKASKWEKNYMVDPNNILARARSKVGKREKVLGILKAENGKAIFYFAESTFGNRRSSAEGGVAVNTRNYLLDFYTNPLSLKDALKEAGNEIVIDKTNCDIDLSPENLDKSKILELLV